MSQPILSLGSDFYDKVRPASFPQTKLRYQNKKMAAALGISLNEEDWVKHFARFEPYPGNLEDALALRYHGHQFMHYNPNLGDGRGFLYAQFLYRDKWYDLGTKGSGKTPYSRGGDGRLTLKGAVRELLASSYLEAQGVNTSKAFSVIETGESLQRNDEPSPTRSAVLVRMSHGHIRIGSFQRLANLAKVEELKRLLYYSLKTYYPNAVITNDLLRDIKSFLSLVSIECAKTSAQWMMAGFTHGVLNTDNINISGESFDYGPYRFLPYYDPDFTAAYFDYEKLYAYGKQPQIVYWNLQQLLLCFTILDIEREELLPAIASYTKVFSEQLIKLFLRRLHINPTNQVENNKLFSATFTFLEESRCPFEDFFFDWFSPEARGFKALTGRRKDYYKGNAFNRFYQLLKGFKDIEESKAKLAYYQSESAENLYIDEIERIWKEIADKDDWQPLYEKLKRIEAMPR